mgnify:CR=1 FL=1
MSTNGVPGCGENNPVLLGGFGAGDPVVGDWLVAVVVGEDGDLACWVLAYVVGASAALPVVAGLVGVAAFLEGCGFACGVEGVGVEGQGYGGAVGVQGGDDVRSALVFGQLLFGHLLSFGFRFRSPSPR